ncbi:hypothetical protein HanHA300_Chr01g0006021 [Helianthus annuus]|nr:hypothetical protein HanHA300_Chr01g0006021 [Helianthus annuus]
MKFLVLVCSFIKRTNINELPTKRFTNYSLNIRLIYSLLFGQLTLYIIKARFRYKKYISTFGNYVSF